MYAKRLFSVVLAIAVFFCATAAAADGYPRGKVIEGAVMPSKILNRDVRYTIYLPPDYDASSRTYPILYLLHGGGDDDTVWVHYGEVDHAADKGIAEGVVTPMIIVTPDGRRFPEDTPRTYYMNDADGKYRWADMFMEEFIPFIENEYRVRKNWVPRAIGGLSMGGYGALMFSMQNPGMFSATIALSSGIYTVDQIVAFDEHNFNRRYGPGFGAMGKTGLDRLTEDYYKKHPLGLMQRMKDEDLRKLNLYIDCGAEDRFDAGNFELHHFLMGKKIPHVFGIRTGLHEWQFWREGIGKGLEFASSAFHR